MRLMNFLFYFLLDMLLLFPWGFELYTALHCGHILYYSSHGLLADHCVVSHYSFPIAHLQAACVYKELRSS